MMLWHSLSSVGGIQTGPATWDPTVNSDVYTFSSSNRVVTRTSGDALHRVTRATTSVSSGKYYWEFEKTGSGDNNISLGLIRPGDSITTYLGQTAGGYSWQSELSRTVHNDTIESAPYGNPLRRTCYALDMDNGAFWMGELDGANNVLWMSGTSLLSPGGTVNPATNAGARFTGLSGSYFPALSIFRVGDAFRARFSQGEWIGIGRPSGFIQLP